jgi:hypothetical protein
LFVAEGFCTFCRATVTNVDEVTFCGVAFVIQKVFCTGAGGEPEPTPNPLIPLWLWTLAELAVKLAPLELVAFAQPTDSKGESQI